MCVFVHSPYVHKGNIHAYKKRCIPGEGSQELIYIYSANGEVMVEVLGLRYCIQITIRENHFHRVPYLEDHPI